MITDKPSTNVENGDDGAEPTTPMKKLIFPPEWTEVKPTPGTTYAFVGAPKLAPPDEPTDLIFRQAAEAMMGELKEFHEDFDEWRKGFYASIRTWIDDNRELTTRQFDTIREMYKDYCDPNAAVTRRTHS